METFSALLALCAGNSPHKGQWRRALMFSFICAWINGWVNNREAGDLRRHRAHYDVIIMLWYNGHFCYVLLTSGVSGNVILMRWAFPGHIQYWCGCLMTNIFYWQEMCMINSYHTMHEGQKGEHISTCVWLTNISSLTKLIDKKYCIRWLSCNHPSKRELADYKEADVSHQAWSPRAALSYWLYCQIFPFGLIFFSQFLRKVVRK